MILIKEQKLGSALTDTKANLSVIGAYQIVEEALTELMGDLHIDGVTAKREYGAVWVIAKNKIELIKDVAWNEDYTVTAFISKITGVSIRIDVAVKNGAEELCAYSRVELCALDVETGKIRRVSTVGTEGIETHEALREITFGKLRFDEFLTVDQVIVRYTNIDSVGHTNNKEYIRFLLNTYTVREMEVNPVREIEIVYVNQSFEGDLLSIQKEQADGKDLFVIKKDDQIIIRCEITK